MGHLIYGNMRVEFEDRVLAHMQIVIVNKLRRAESFAVSWRDANEVGDGRSAIWVDPSIALYFKFDGPGAPEIDREWIVQLANSADSSTGLVVAGRDGETVVGMPAIGIALSGRKANGANGSGNGGTRGRPSADVRRGGAWRGAKEVRAHGSAGDRRRQLSGR